MATRIYFAGVGFGFVYNCAIVVVCQHFVKYLPLALGVSLAGGGVGNLLFPWVSTALIQHFGWRGLYILSMIFLRIILVAENLLLYLLTR